MKTYILFIILFAILFIIVFTILFCQNKSIIEPFIISACPNCGKRNRPQCFECSNFNSGGCGWCIKSNGEGQCVPGNQNGPYFNSDCLYWEYKPKTNKYYHFNRWIPQRIRTWWDWRRLSRK